MTSVNSLPTRRYSVNGDVESNGLESPHDWDRMRRTGRVESRPKGQASISAPKKPSGSES